MVVSLQNHAQPPAIRQDEQKSSGFMLKLRVKLCSFAALDPGKANLLSPLACLIAGHKHEKSRPGGIAPSVGWIR
jgi:hypothetical protein